MKYVALSALLCCILLSPSCATARLTHDERDALKTLNRYLSLDRTGARLDQKRYGDMMVLVTWPEEPGWDSFVVISGSTIGRPQLTNGKIASRVRYTVEGIMEGDTFHPIRTLDAEMASRFAIGQPAEFVLTRDSGGWKIESPQLPPHVGFDATRAFVQEIGAENSLRALSDAEYVSKLKGARAGHCNCERLDF